MQPIAKSVKKQVRSTESSHIVNTTIRLSRNAVLSSWSLLWLSSYSMSGKESQFDSVQKPLDGTNRMKNQKTYKPKIKTTKISLTFVIIGLW